MRIAIASYAFHGLVKEGKMDVFGYLEACKYRYGLAAADIWNGMLPSMEEDYLRKVRDALDERELELANLCVDQAHIWEPEATKREQNYQNALAHLRAAVILGAKTVRIDAGGRNATWDEGQFELVVKRYQEYARFAYDHGFKIGPENHWGPERELSNMKELFKAVNHPAFGLLLHFGNWGGVPVDEGDAAAAPWAMHMHMMWSITEGPLEAKMKLLADAGYQGYWSIEYHAAQNEYAQVAIQVAKVRDVLQRWRVAGK
jgi:sugar phosphate isomerase/epimerase